MIPLGAGGIGPANTISILKEARARVAAKRSGVSSNGSSASRSVTKENDLVISRTNTFEQKIEEDGLPTTIIYDAFGRFRRAIMPKGQVVDIYM